MLRKEKKFSNKESRCKIRRKIMANLKFKGNVFFPFSYFFFLHSSYSFCNFNFGTKVTFLNILFIELERGERKSNENDDKEKKYSFSSFFNYETHISRYQHLSFNEMNSMVVSFSYKHA